jgi:VCBS repeat-containing protein
MWQQASQIFAIPIIQRDRFTIPTTDLSSQQLNITVTGTTKTERNTL